MSNTILVDLSNALADAAELAGKSTVLVDARRRMPASGIVYASDLILTAEHVIEKEEDISVVLGDENEVSARVAGRYAGSDLAYWGRECSSSAERWAARVRSSTCCATVRACSVPRSPPPAA